MMYQPCKKYILAKKKISKKTARVHLPIVYGVDISSKVWYLCFIDFDAFEKTFPELFEEL